MKSWKCYGCILGAVFLMSCAHTAVENHNVVDSAGKAARTASVNNGLPGKTGVAVDKKSVGKGLTGNGVSDNGSVYGFQNPGTLASFGSTSKDSGGSNGENNITVVELNGQESPDTAIDLLSQAQAFWEKGDLDDALKSLDEAYALILDINGDPDLSRSKDELRLMISKMIVQICASRHTVAKGNQSEIPLVMNADIEKEIRSFQTVERGFFLRSYQRSGMYLPVIDQRLQEAGLPKELAWLPLVESGFQINALSRARALGLWQFIPSTGYKYSLKRDRWVDQRMDLEKSTKAAIAYLNELHEIFGDWLTVLAAYNCGEGRVLRVISKQHINYLDRFWDLYRQLPTETARYVPRFLATLHIIKNPKKYGMDLSENPDEPIPYEIAKTEKCMRLQDIASHLEISQEILASLNSELRLKMTPEGEYHLKVPVGMGEKYACIADQIEKWEPPRPKTNRVVFHHVKKGETIGKIAARYGVSTRGILAANKMSSKQVLRAGRSIRIPVNESQTVSGGDAKTSAMKKGKKETASVAVVIKYKVKKGDTLSSIAARYNVGIGDIKENNNIKGDKLFIGQVIKIKRSDSAKGG
jgi:membrane-bound lytic murein transglycosylase D